MIKWPGRRKAVLMRKHHMAEARSAYNLGLAKADPIYIDIARVHVRTAWGFSRNVWRGPPKYKQ